MCVCVIGVYLITLCVHTSLAIRISYYYNIIRAEGLCVRVSARVCECARVLYYYYDYEERRKVERRLAVAACPSGRRNAII